MNKVPNKIGKKYQLNLLKAIGVDIIDADRIVGGMMRLEERGGYWPKYVKKCLKLAKTPKETHLIWYMLGVKVGILSTQGMVVVSPFGKKAIDKIRKKGETRPEVQ